MKSNLNAKIPIEEATDLLDRADKSRLFYRLGMGLA